MVENVEQFDFTFGRLNELAAGQGCKLYIKPCQLANSIAGYVEHKAATTDSSTTTNIDSEDITDPLVSPTETLDRALSTLNSQITALHTSLPPSTALILLTGQSDPRPMMELIAKRQKWERLVKTVGAIGGLEREEKWLSEDDRELERRVAEAREGMAFFCVKGKGQSD